jgi:glutamyl endopeptidase
MPNIISPYDLNRNIKNSFENTPISSISKLLIHTAKGIVAGTGFFVHPKIVLTAGHCVMEGKRKFVSNIDIYPGIDSTSINDNGIEKYSSKYFYVSKKFFNKPSIENDFGFIILNDTYSFNGEIFGLEPEFNKSISYNITGYTYKEYESQIINSYKQTTFSNVIINGVKKKYLLVDGSFFPGQSGSPFYHFYDNRFFSCGLFIGSSPNSSFVVRISDETVLEELKLLKVKFQIIN